MGKKKGVKIKVEGPPPMFQDEEGVWHVCNDLHFVFDRDILDWQISQFEDLEGNVTEYPPLGWNAYTWDGNKLDLDLESHWDNLKDVVFTFHYEGEGLLQLESVKWTYDGEDKEDVTWYYCG